MELLREFRIINFTFNKNGKNESGYTCIVKSITYNPALRTIEIIGNHQDFKGNEDVRGLTMYGIKNLRGIPYGLTKIFPNLIYLQIRKCGLKSLTKKDLLGLEHLQGLWLGENELNQLDNNVFENCQGIKILCLHKNKLKIIGSDILKPLKSLSDANFSENTCIDKNYINGNEDQLNELVEEIIRKCQNTTDMNEIDDSKLEYISLKKEVFLLKNQVSTLENRIKIMEAEKNGNAQIISRIDLLEQIISDMQIRLTIIEDS